MFFRSKLKTHSESHRKETLGIQAERYAERYLLSQGLKTCERNFHSRYGEIDLIMKQDDILVFIEVRYRKSSTFGNPVETVNWRKQEKFIRTAQYYLQHHSHHNLQTARIDVLGITGNLNLDKESNYHWIQNAFGMS